LVVVALTLLAPIILNPFPVSSLGAIVQHELSCTAAAVRHLHPCNRFTTFLFDLTKLSLPFGRSLSGCRILRRRLDVPAVLNIVPAILL
jgi:hypothetical protein